MSINEIFLLTDFIKMQCASKDHLPVSMENNDESFMASVREMAQKLIDQTLHDQSTSTVGGAEMSATPAKHASSSSSSTPTDFHTVENNLTGDKDMVRDS